MEEAEGGIWIDPYPFEDSFLGKDSGLDPRSCDPRVEDPVHCRRPPMGALKHQSDHVCWIKVNPLRNRPGSLVFMWCFYLQNLVWMEEMSFPLGDKNLGRLSEN